MNAVESVTVVLVEIQCARTQWVLRAAGHASSPLSRKFVALNHRGRRCPCRPFGFALDDGSSGPRKALAADADAIADGLPAGLNEVEELVAGIDDNCSRCVTAPQAYLAFPVFRTAACVTLAGLVATAIWTNWIPVAWKWFTGVVSACWHWTFSSHAIPGWLVILGGFATCAYALKKLWDIVESKAKAAGPDESDFTEMRFNNLIWRWNKNQFDAQIHVYSFCPVVGCDMQIHGEEFDQGRYVHSVFQCSRCGHKVELSGRTLAAENQVVLEIQRLFRTGEWKQHVKPKVAA